MLNSFSRPCVTAGTVIGALWWSCSWGLCGEVVSVSSVNFGTIDLFPGGDSIIIDARNGPALPAATRSVITGGGSGKISLTSDIVESVSISYPPSVSLSNGTQQIIVDQIATYSEYSGTPLNFAGDGSVVGVDVGGRLQLTGGEIYSGYSGTMVIGLNFF